MPPDQFSEALAQIVESFGLFFWREMGGHARIEELHELGGMRDGQGLDTAARKLS